MNTGDNSYIEGDKILHTLLEKFKTSNEFNIFLSSVAWPAFRRREEERENNAKAVKAMVRLSAKQERKAAAEAVRSVNLSWVCYSRGGPQMTLAQFRKLPKGAVVYAHEDGRPLVVTHRSGGQPQLAWKTP